MSNPKVSIIIPTLNAQKTIETCLKSIKKQRYPRFEIIIADGGSTDATIKIAQKYDCIIVDNPLQSAEAGKAAALKVAKGNYVALIDSDNILPHPNWLAQMITPLETDADLVGSEPWKFTYRRQGGFIERYSALIGANDPYAFLSGSYDRYSYLTRRWTDLDIPTLDQGNYLKITLTPGKPLPTIGANGTVFRTDFLTSANYGDYLFDIDILSTYLNSRHHPLYFAKVKNGIIHTFCENSPAKFYRKQLRRLTDYYHYLPQRKFNWDEVNRRSQLRFVLYSVSFLPGLIDACRGFINKPDPAWFFHPFACLITLYTYALVTIKHKLNLLSPINRQQWQQ